MADTTTTTAEAPAAAATAAGEAAVAGDTSAARSDSGAVVAAPAADATGSSGERADGSVDSGSGVKSAPAPAVSTAAVAARLSGGDGSSVPGPSTVFQLVESSCRTCMAAAEHVSIDAEALATWAVEAVASGELAHIASQDAPAMPLTFANTTAEVNFWGTTTAGPPRASLSPVRVYSQRLRVVAATVCEQRPLTC